MTAEELVAKAKNIPPVPHAALKLVNLMGDPEASNEEIVAVLKCDNVLTAKLLRACNSPYFGLEDPVLSVDQSVILLGHQQILQIILTLAFGRKTVGTLPGYAMDADELWMHSYMTAIAAEAVANEFPRLNVEPSTAFTIGLLHDIGKLVLGQALSPEVQETIREKVQELQISRFAAEKMVLGADHCEVGACLLRAWGLPEQILEAVANHHHPGIDPVLELSAVTYVADFIAHLAGTAPSWEGYTFRINHEVADRLNLNGERLENLVASVRNSFDRMDLFMNMG